MAAAKEIKKIKDFSEDEIKMILSDKEILSLISQITEFVFKNSAISLINKSKTEETGKFHTLCDTLRAELNTKGYSVPQNNYPFYVYIIHKLKDKSLNP